MAYNILWSAPALDALSAFDVKTKTKVMDKVEFYLADNPLRLSKPLKGFFSGLYRYRMGKIRIIFALNEKNNTLVVARIGIRKDVYEV
ncbi:type II toxin-antitoxin system RelE family toxin [Candidatus Magnetomonas plexicatena]|uniref:type II toxin-antitoxin system RelE family toxin n=1 Tax=Candidatus Magnetomonas plexicatena TaxID=2552947 RepID=UPI001C754C94|nr:type II toxin-antitoxin system RelE/ParE family toxin [Nitrospirales bacterium LBB_01]